MTLSIAELTHGGVEVTTLLGLHCPPGQNLDSSNSLWHKGLPYFQKPGHAFCDMFAMAEV
jgi:hypothetical protein